MTIFGLDSGMVRAMLEPLATPGGSESETLDDASAAGRFARAAWSVIVEPGDGVAGWLTSALGPAVALTAVIERWSPERIEQAVRGTDGDSYDDSGDDRRAELAAAQERWQPRVASAAVVRACEQAARIGARMTTPEDGAWPGAISGLGPHAPIMLWWRGTEQAFGAFGNAVALVGARAATGYGEHVAMEASAGLVDRGYAIVSGAAYGIDGTAHRTALASTGTTMAFLAGGVDRFYPSGHDALLAKIVETGLVLSELPCGAAPTKWRFLQRNRLIAASSLATVVLEAGRRSGSLNTAGHASALGRPLGAVPGPVTSPASAGCHRLIREYAAVCVTNAEEMAELAGGGLSGPDDPADGSTGDRSSDETRVIDALSTRSPRTLADVAQRAGLSVGAVQAVVGTLDLEGAVGEREAGWLLNPAK